MTARENLRQHKPSTPQEYGDMPMKDPKEPTRERNYLDSESFGGLVFLVAVVSLGISIYTKDASWFGRSGSLVTLGGLLRSGRALLRQAIWDDVRVDVGQTMRNELDERESRNRWQDLAAAKEGMAFVAAGTIIWGYGDLLTPLIRLLRG
jgi:hypothetical protein